MLYNAKADERLPLTLDARPVGDVLVLNTVRLAGSREASDRLPDSARLAMPVTRLTR